MFPCLTFCVQKTMRRFLEMSVAERGLQVFLTLTMSVRVKLWMLSPFQHILKCVFWTLSSYFKLETFRGLWGSIIWIRKLSILSYGEHSVQFEVTPVYISSGLLVLVWAPLQSTLLFTFASVFSASLHSQLQGDAQSAQFVWNDRSAEPVGRNICWGSTHTFFFTLKDEMLEILFSQTELIIDCERKMPPHMLADGIWGCSIF